MAHQDHLAVVIVELADGVLQASLQFLLDGGGCRRQILIEQLARQIERGAIGPAGPMHRLFAINAALLRQVMAPMSVDEVVLGDVP